jgi:hypothetical protein
MVWKKKSKPGRKNKNAIPWVVLMTLLAMRPLTLRERRSQKARI